MTRQENTRQEQDLAFQEWVERARDVTTIEAAERHLGFVALKRKGGQLKRIGACTACGTSGSLKPALADRFCIFISGTKAGGFACRKCNIHGGDAIALLMQSTGQSFVEAVETLTGDPLPRGQDRRSEAERAEARAKIDAKKAENERRRAEADAAAAREAQDRKRWAGDVWRKSVGLPGSPAEGYLRHRGVRHFAGINLDHAGFVPALKLKADDGTVLHEGPVMVWQVVDPAGHLSAVHRTWLNPDDFGVPGGKGRPRVLDPDTGEAVATKKTLGIKEGCAIRVVRGIEDGLPPVRLYLAEGVETLLAVREALMAVGHPNLKRAAFWSACDLYNIAALRLPDAFDEVWLLGDGDSERRTIEGLFLDHTKANNRPGRVFVPCFAEAGKDFSDMWGMA